MSTKLRELIVDNLNYFTSLFLEKIIISNFM